MDLDSDGESSPSKPKNELHFRDPSEYENMTQEEKDDLTRRMMNQHSNIKF